MANRTVKDAQTIKGTNPQYLVEKIIRTRIYDCKYWKEECFALTAELLVDKAMELRYVAGTYAGNIKPSPFLCLCLKMLQIQPEKDIIIEFIKSEDYKYVRALGAFYLRLTGSSLDCYKYLEPLLNDYRKIRMQNRDGKFVLSHMDEFIDSLLREERACDVILPRLQKRSILEESNDLEHRVSILDDDLEEAETSSEEEEEPEEKRHISEEQEERERRRRRERERERRGRSRSKSRERKTASSSSSRRDRSRDRDSRRRRDHRDRSRERSRRDRDHHHRDNPRESRGGGRREERSGGGGGGGGKESMSIEETNKMRAALGMAPLRN